jgi:hypothetical protein
LPVQIEGAALVVPKAGSGQAVAVLVDRVVAVAASGQVVVALAVLAEAVVVAVELPVTDTR